MRKNVSDLSDSYVSNYDRITFGEVSLRFIDIAFSELRNPRVYSIWIRQVIASSAKALKMLERAFMSMPNI